MEGEVELDGMGVVVVAVVVDATLSNYLTYLGCVVVLWLRMVRDVR